ncbi:MAG TPA: hypothetical protein VFG20_09040 [Planctomycetaceae bacterium]|nr:hypothetical protein [Planctomycetaceae bacterium]
MASKRKSLLDLRREAEAVEARGGDATATKAEKAAATKAKKAAAPKAKRVAKEKPVARKRMIWVVYNGSMKEEGRFPYDQRAAAEEKIEALRQKSKKLYFIHPVKEVIGDPSATVGLVAAAAAAALKAAAAAAVVEQEEAEIPEEVIAEMDEEIEQEEEEEEDDSEE